MREMKDSGIEWVKNIPLSWKILPIYAIFEPVKQKNNQGMITNALKFTYGEIVEKTNFDVDGDDYVAKTIRNYTIVQPGNIMINGLNLNFDFVSQRVGLVRNLGVITSAYMALKIKDISCFLPEYATYLFKSYDLCKAFHNMGGGIRKILNFDELKRYYIIVPSIAEQNSIVMYLNRKCTEIDSIIDGIESEILTLEKYKQCLISETIMKGLNPNVEMRDSGVDWIGLIPSYWSVKRAKYIFTQRNMKGNNKNLELLSPTQKYGVIPQSLYEEYSGMTAVKLKEDYDLTQLKTIHKGDFCISLRSFQGGFEYSNYEGVVSPAYQVFFPNTEIVDGYFKYLFKETTFIKKINSYAMSLRDGKNISFENFGKTYLPIPSLQDQAEISSFLDGKCDEIDAIIEKNKVRLDTLNEYKKSLIYECVTGKKEVPAV